MPYLPSTARFSLGRSMPYLPPTVRFSLGNSRQGSHQAIITPACEPPFRNPQNTPAPPSPRPNILSPNPLKLHAPYHTWLV
jgi:hypothetical protein